MNLLFLFLSPVLSLNVLTYPLSLGNIKTNGFITSSKYPIKHLDFFFLSTNFEMTILSILTSNFYKLFCAVKLFFCYQISTLLYYQELLYYPLFLS